MSITKKISQINLPYKSHNIHSTNIHCVLLYAKHCNCFEENIKITMSNYVPFFNYIDSEFKKILDVSYVFFLNS